jgi:hypothetical protein
MGDLKISIFDAGDLSKPANTLIEKISDALGGYFKPYQIKRVAEAEAEADKIRACSQIEIGDLQRRALHRFLVEEAKKQNNMETITQKALPQVSDQASPQNVEDDWITNFFDKCRLISDEEMQNLWAKVLAGEANAPGKYSKRTVNLLAGLDKNDAETFGRLCSFVVYMGPEPVPLVYDFNHPIYIKYGVTFDSLSHLDSIGLIHFDPLAGYMKTSLREGHVSYCGDLVWIGFGKPEKNEMRTGNVMMTKAGMQLAPICGSKPRDGFVEYVREVWKRLGYMVDQPAEQGPATSGGSVTPP